jgi:GTPase SAR1 family protein
MDVILPSVQHFPDPAGTFRASTSQSVARPDLRPTTDLPDQLSVVILGDRGAGTTSLIARARTGSFQNKTKKTVGADGVTHSVQVPGYKCKLRVWDCASLSEESCPSELKQFVKRLILRAHVVLVAYTEPSQATCTTIKLVTDTLKSKHSSALVVGVMTKADQKRKRKPPCKERAAAEIIQTMSGLQHFVCSAKTGYGVAHLFDTVIGQAVISRSWQPGCTAAAQRRAWAQVCAHRQVPMQIAAAVARRLHGECTPWSVVGQASIDSAASEASIGRWEHALFDLTIANAVFKGTPELRDLTWRALLHCVQIDIPRAELVTDSMTGTEHTTYVLRCRAATGDGSWVEQFVSRRYSEFVSLHAAIQLRTPASALLLQTLPPKRASYSTLRPAACYHFVVRVRSA